eukprot:scaffold46638_cov31-Prasinocladus_malaysianus.AAC.1
MIKIETSAPSSVVPFLCSQANKTDWLQAECADLYGVSGARVSLEGLLAVLAEPLLGGVGHYLVVQALPDHPVLVGREGHRRDRVHAGVRDVLDDHRDAILPDTDRLVVAGAHKALAFVHK